jgi:uncharacterized protein
LNSEMRYNVAQLLKGPTGATRKYLFEEEIDRLDPDLTPLSPLVGSVTLMRTSQGILVTGRLRTTLEGTCRRCLERCEVKVPLVLEEEYYPVTRIADAPIDEVPEEERDEALLIDERHTLDLSEVIRQGLWLAMPMEALCRPDCAGLCPRCGGNRNLGECRCEEAPVDPRWAALQAFFSSEQDSKERSE